MAIYFADKQHGTAVNGVGKGGVLGTRFGLCGCEEATCMRWAVGLCESATSAC